MAHDPARAAEARAWDCQGRAAEKALKGFRTWHDRPFRKTHSLEEIGEQSLALDPALRPIIDRAVPLTEYAWKFRYLGEMDEPSRTETAVLLGVRRATASIPAAASHEPRR